MRRQGFTWGTPPDTLLEVLNKSNGDDERQRKFDLILLSDLVFNHSQHLALLNTCLSCLSPTPSSSSASTSTPREPSTPASDATTAPPKEGEEEEESKVDLSDPTTLETPAVLCFFSHHRPWLVDADLQILHLARDKGWRVSKVWEDKRAGVSSLLPLFLLLVSTCLYAKRRVEQGTREGWLADSCFPHAPCNPTDSAQPAFPEDGGDLAIRSTVHGWLFTRP